MNRSFTLLLTVLSAAAAACALAQDLPPQVLAAAPGLAPTLTAVGVLVLQAQRWLDLGRPELAAQSVQRALSAEPRNPEILLLALRMETARNNRESAAVYAERLRGADATPEQLASADSELRAASVDRHALDEARRLAGENKPEEAVAQYRAAFGRLEPSSAYAREYYQALASTSAGREVGRRALARLAAQPNADGPTLLANAQQLTFTPATRADGIRLLAELATRPGVDADAQRGWKQALGFYENDAAAAPLYEEYLRRYPTDTDIRQRLVTARAAPVATAVSPGDDLRHRGFADLESGSLRSSAQRFEAAIVLDPKDADALGGLGVVRLRENKPAEARDLLDRAIAAAPTKAGQWRKALDGANYTLELAEARGLLRRSNAADADTILRRAVRRDVEDSTDAESMLGETASRRGDAVEAEQHFRAALARRPGFAPSVTGLAQALRSQGRVAEANALRSPTPPSGQGPGSGNNAGSANPEVARLRAEASRSPDPVTESGLLNAARALAPNDPWLRLDLARALRRMGRDAEGRAMVEELAVRAPTSDASYAAALLAQESGRPADAEAFLSSIPPQRLNADMARLQVRVRNQSEISRAAALLLTAPVDARRRLLLMAARPDPSGDTAADVIRALGGVGDTAGATEAAHVAEAVNRTAPARIAVAGALLAAGLDTAAASMAAGIENERLTEGQRRDLAALRTGTAIRASDRLNEAGEQTSAYERLRPALASNPGDPAVELALARLYQSARRPADAQRIADAVLARNPRNADARRAAVEAAIDAGDRRRAEMLTNEMRTGAPNDSRDTFLQARVARAFGNENRARTLLLEAAAQREQELGSVSPTGPAGAPVSSNPFERAGNFTPSTTASGPQDRISREISQELASVRNEAATRISGGVSIRTRSGTAGLDSLTELASPLEAAVSPAAFPGRVTVRVNPVMLDAGRLPTTGEPALRFGTNTLSSAPVSPVATTATGVGLNLAYRRGEVFAMDIGTSPIGFRDTNILGGVEIAPRLSDSVRLRLKADRRNVVDSLLSYAGERDPITGETWGGVTQTGGRVQLDSTLGAGSAYILGGYAILDGQNVAHNTRTEAGAGFSYPIWKQSNSELTTGLDLVYFAYDNNQRGFTLGQGGYFSPQSFVAMNVPVTYRSHLGDLKYLLSGTIGYARFREDASPLFPNNPRLQSQVEAASQLNPRIPTRNISQNKNGVTGGIRIELEYPLTESLTLSGTLGYDKAADFEATRVRVRLEHAF